MRISYWSSDVCSSDLARGENAVDVGMPGEQVAGGGDALGVAIGCRGRLGEDGGDTARGRRGGKAVAPLVELALRRALRADEGEAAAPPGDQMLGGEAAADAIVAAHPVERDRKSTRLNSSH